MLSIYGKTARTNHRFCDGYSRRDFLKVGGIGQRAAFSQIQSKNEPLGTNQCHGLLHHVPIRQRFQAKKDAVDRLVVGCEIDHALDTSQIAQAGIDPQ